MGFEMAVREKPILFSAPMVQAILAGRKTMTRRVVKPQPPHGKKPWECGYSRTGWAMGEDPAVVFPAGCYCSELIRCPYGFPGERLWVRETWRCFGGREYEYQQHQPSIVYRATASLLEGTEGDWRPSIHMPRWASRIALEIADIRVERLREISEADAMAEGIVPTWPDGVPIRHDGTGGICREAFAELWDKLNAARGFAWEANPWVWVIVFRRVETEVRP